MAGPLLEVLRMAFTVRAIGSPFVAMCIADSTRGNIDRFDARQLARLMARHWRLNAAYLAVEVIGEVKANVLTISTDSALRPVAAGGTRLGEVVAVVMDHSVCMAVVRSPYMVWRSCRACRRPRLIAVKDRRQAAGLR